MDIVKEYLFQLLLAQNHILIQNDSTKMKSNDLLILIAQLHYLS